MTRKIVCIFAILGPLSVSVQAQESVSKPTKADAVKVVKIISADKAKIGTYCKLADLGDELTRPGALGITARSSDSASRPTTWQRPWGQNLSG
jgi:hypothetical protein